jgi:dTDP-4-amino-4,6-dideoxygalactose transaminase
MSLPKANTVPERQSSKLSEWRVPLSQLSCSEREITRITSVLRSGWWTCGPETEALEKEFAARLGVRHAIAVTNGTAALHLAFVALGLSKGDEVVTPALNFVAAANTILYAGAIPRFAEVAAVDTPLVSADTLERAITPKTRGVCVMHYGGYPCAMDSIVEWAHRRGLWIVEDAAHAPGASWNGISCGGWGDIGCFSFFGNKNLTCAEGGLVVTENDDYAKRLRLLRSHGMDSLTWDRFRGHSFSYDVTVPGLNYRMDDLRAALLRIQLQSLDRWNGLRQERVAWYRRLLGSDPRWTIPFENYPGVSAYHLMPVVLAEGVSRSGIMSFLKSVGIQTSIHYPPVHQFSCYRKLLPHSGLKRTEDLGRRILTLPLYPGMSYLQVELVCNSFHEAIENANAGIEKAG